MSITVTNYSGYTAISRMSSGRDAFKGAEMVTPIGALIRERRKSLDMTQEDLEERTGIRQSEISQIERGSIRQPGWDKLMAIAHQLQLTETDIAHALMRSLGIDLDVKGGVYVSIIGTVPADNIRLTESEEGQGDMPQIEVTPSEVADVRDPFALEVSGDCLRSIGILSGDVVIVEPAHGRAPRHNQIVVVRLNQEVTMKRWVETNAHVELRDGDDNIVATVDPEHGRNVEVLAFYVTYRPLAPR